MGKTDSHIQMLQMKHRELEAKIREEERAPLPNYITLHALKARKLSIKDEITRNLRAA
jgi:hypothetical protein